MGQYRKKPVVIDAVQFDGKNGDEVRRTFPDVQFWEVDPEDRGDDPDVIAEVLDVLHSTRVGVKAAQWIIRGVQGEFYPCAPGVFAATYDSVSEA